MLIEKLQHVRDVIDKPMLITKGVAYAKCKQKFQDAKGDTAPPKKFFCADFPEARNYQECMQKKKKVEECRRNPSMC